MITRETGAKLLSNSQRLRQEALSVLFAKYVSETDNHVIRFRNQTLGQKFPLPVAQVESWIKSQHKKDLRQAGGKAKAIGGKVLSYGGPALKTVKGGILERLQSISELLAKFYRWDESQTAYFVLTDIAPSVQLFEVECIYPTRIFAAARISLTLDPALTDKEVAAIYRQARKKMLKKDKKGKARFRVQSEKHLRLAIFEADQSEGLSYRLKMKVWNEQFPKWHYKHESNFIRDSKKAIQRLLQPDYFDWEGMFNG